MRHCYRLRRLLLTAAIAPAVFALAATPLAAAETSLAGYVFGQDDQGAHLGPVANAKLEFTGGDGKTLAAQSDDNGYYLVPAISPGEYRYKIAAAGYRDEDSGRGLQIPAGNVFNNNFVLTRGPGKAATPTSPAMLSGHVWKASGTEKTPLGEAVVALRPESSGTTLLIRTAGDGSYSLALSAGKWRASARADGFLPQIQPSAVEVAAGDKAVLDFTFSSTTTTTTTTEKAVEVQAMIAVQPSADMPRGRLPQVKFVAGGEGSGGRSFAATAIALQPDELAALGLTVDTADEDHWEWFTAKPDEPLPVGEYRAEAALEGYHPAASDGKAISADRSTYFDVTLRPTKPKPPKAGSPTVPVAAPPTDTFVHGRVLGQDDKGNHLGIVAGAKLQLTDKAGKPVADATADENGYYRIADLKPGEYHYTLTADGYCDERAGRGFVMPSIAVYVHDFVLTKGTASPPATPKPTELAGHVWEEKSGGKQPIAGAIVALRPEASGPTLLTRSAADGAYSFAPPPGTWRASAVADGFPPFVETKPLTIAAGDKSTLDFTFKKSETAVAGGKVLVYVAVQPSQTAPRGRVPQVRLRGGDASHAAKVRAIDDRELAELGLASSSQGSWDWFIAEPEQSLPPGEYSAAAELAEYRPDQCDPKGVEAVGQTFFDLTLRAEKPAESESPAAAGSPALPQATVVHGRVTGQDDKGNHIGVVAGAYLVVSDSTGRRVRAVATDANGYYRLLNMRPGEYHYALTAESYRDENAHRGFNVPAPGVYVFDFVMTWGKTPGSTPPDPTPPTVAGNPSPMPTTSPPVTPTTIVCPAPCVLTGHVWKDADGEKSPLPGVVVALCLPDTRQAILVRTCDEGTYEVALAPGSWRASAVADGFEAQVKQEPIVCAEGEKKTLDFTFTESSEPAHAPIEVVALVGLESAHAAVGLHADSPPGVVFVCGDDAEAGPLSAIVAPLSGQEKVQLLTEFGILTSDTTDDYDWFVARSAEPFAPGRYRVEGRKEGYVTSASSQKTAVAGVRTLFEVRLHRIRPDVTVIVQGSDKSPVKDVEVKLINKDLGRRFDQAVTLKTDAAGRSSTTLADGTGTYNAMLSGVGLQPQGREVTIQDATTTLTFQVFKEGEQRTADFAGTVYRRKKALDPSAPATSASQADSEPLTGAKITLRPQGGETVPASLAAPLVSKEGGAFEARSVPEGEYLVLVEAEGCTSLTAQLKVSSEMSPVRYDLDPRNVELDNALRRMLTDGWGREPEKKAIAERAYQDAIKADPKGCRPEYAMALTLMKAGDFAGAYQKLHAAVTKKQADFYWDRVCEARIYLDMFQRQPKQAALEMEALATLHYADRPVNHAGEETSHLMGVACGVLREPWKKEAMGIDLDRVEKAILDALPPPHRAEFERGRDEVAARCRELTEAKDGAEKTELAKADEQKQKDQAIADARQQEIDAEKQRLGTAAEEAQAAAQQKAAELEQQNNALVLRRQQLVTSAAPLIARRDQINQCLALDRGRATSVNPSDPSALSSPDPAVLEEIRQHEYDLLVIGRQLQPLLVEDQQLQAQQASLQMEYNRTAAQLNGVMQQLNSKNSALNREQGNLEQKERLRDKVRPMSTAAADLALRMSDFTTFGIYPLEQRRQEVLELISR